MKIKAIGTGTQLDALADAAREAGHEVSMLATSPDEPGLLGGEQLLDPESTDAVLVGAGWADPQRTTEQVTQLAKNGVPLLTVFPLVDSVLSYHEIDLARGDGRSVVSHFNPLLENAGVIADCQRWVAEGHPQLGKVESVSLERQMEDRRREPVLRSFAADIELLQAVTGRFNQLGAHGPDSTDENYHALSVQLTGKSRLPVRWSVGPVSEGGDARLTLVTERGKIVAAFDASGAARRLTVGGVEHPCDAGPPAERAAVERFLNSVQHRDASASTWTEALHAMELVDTVEISLRRGRIIEVHDQQLTEDLAFRGTMSALGCGLIMVLLPAVMVLGWIGGVIGIPLAEYWPHALLAILALFLVLQAVPKLLFPKQPGPAEG